MLRLSVLPLVLLLSACLDVEADFKLAEDETISTETKVTLGRQLYDMLQLAPQAQGLCPPEAEKIEGPDQVLCISRDETTLEEALTEAASAGNSGDFAGDVEFERIDDETVRLVLPLDFERIEGKPAELTPENPMFAMMTDGLEGAEIVVRFTALEVIESNGAISEDGRSVELVVPTVELLSPTGQLPDQFTAVLKYRDCGLLGC
ncbi:hypothetical protein C8N43_2746 [Litoreibacter ponti]|uniref:Lipoprotein n=1 Tax=Litoreibacter ponti TaxID=1510457 RepID=A0A2T6BPQ7_9RHOB|nr:hypothetical protein [Litoreibacter ponti]PTX58070.1 hypothetical protein C8N43_2746 [Litoreibacter ponti]